MCCVWPHPLLFNKVQAPMYTASNSYKLMLLWWLNRHQVTTQSHAVSFCHSPVLFLIKKFVAIIPLGFPANRAECCTLWTKYCVRIMLYPLPYTQLNILIWHIKLPGKRWSYKSVLRMCSAKSCACVKSFKLIQDFFIMWLQRAHEFNKTTINTNSTWVCNNL